MWLCVWMLESPAVLVAAEVSLHDLILKYFIVSFCLLYSGSRVNSLRVCVCEDDKTSACCHGYTCMRCHSAPSR